LPWLGACVLPDEMAQLEKDVADVRQQLQDMSREHQAALEEIDRLRLQEEQRGAEEAAVTRDDLAEVLLRLDQVSRQASTTTERVNDLGGRVDRYSQDVEQLRALVRAGGTSSPDGAAGVLPSASPDVVPEPPPTDPALATDAAAAVPDPEALYNTAYTDYNKGNYALAIAGFEEYQRLFPESALADNALYWIGESWFSQGDYERAVDAFDGLLERYPKSDKAAAANLKKALAFLERNQVGTAIVQLNYVVQGFPGSDESRIAQDKLSGLGQ
jgi:tol-pal system protein YbgF